MTALRVKDIAPHLAGRMLPAMFDYLGIGKVERFPGDPYAHQQPWAAWFWMHTTECGSPNHVGSSKSWTIPRALRCDEIHATTSPGVGPMGAGQTADAALQQGALFA